MADERRTEKPKTPHKEAPHPLEWVIGALSGIMVAALVAYLGYRAISTDRRPPVFDLAVEEIESVGGAFHIAISATNNGDETAADLVVSATLTDGEQLIETGEIQFDYLPAGSTRRGAFVFRNDPARTGQLRLSVLGYSEP